MTPNGRIPWLCLPRLDFVRIPTRLRVIDGALEIDPSPDPILLRAPGLT